MAKVKVKLPQVGTVRVATSRPRSLTLFTILVWLLFISLVFWLAYSLGAQRLQWPMSTITEEDVEQVQQMRALKEENARLVRELAKVKRTSQVELESVAHIQQTLQDKDLKILKLNEELAFYRGLLAPEKIKAGVRVRDLLVRGSATPGRYSYDLLLTQASQSGRAVKGAISLRVDGRQAGEMRRLDVKNIENEGKSSIKYSFKYFQRLYGVFELPDDFQPTSIIVEVAPSGSGSEPILVSFSWNELITGG